MIVNSLGHFTVIVIMIAVALINSSNAYNAASSLHGVLSTSKRRSSSLFMGRAAAVRANTKARTDGAKAKTYGLFAKKIISVVKAGGPDPESNRQLSSLLADAKAANVPNDVIKRNIEKASSSATADYKESLFEFIGPGGTFILVNVLTDNDNRATQDVALVGKKNLLKAGSRGSVTFNFVKKARLDITGDISEDELMNLCLENDVNDYELKTIVDGNTLSPKEDGKCVVYVDLNDMSAMRDALRGAGFILETSIAHVPKDGLIELSDEDFDSNMNAFDAFLDLDDVDLVEHNINMAY